jgi:hypothetical protein
MFSLIQNILTEPYQATLQLLVFVWANLFNPYFYAPCDKGAYLGLWVEYDRWETMFLGFQLKNNFFLHQTFPVFSRVQ